MPSPTSELEKRSFLFLLKIHAHFLLHRKASVDGFKIVMSHVIPSPLLHVSM